MLNAESDKRDLESNQSVWAMNYSAVKIIARAIVYLQASRLGEPAVLEAGRPGRLGRGHTSPSKAQVEKSNLRFTFLSRLAPGDRCRPRDLLVIIRKVKELAAMLCKADTDSDARLLY